MRLDIQRHYKKVLLVLVLFVAVNTVYLSRHHTGVFTNKIRNKHVLYHKDDSNKLLIVQASNNVVEGSKQSFNHLHYRDIQVVDPKAYRDYDTIYVNEVDYVNITSDTVQGLIEDSKHGELIKVDYHAKFVQNFVKFFSDLFTTINSCKPDVPSINNNDHYRIAKESNEHSNREGRIPLYGGHLRENYLDEEIRTKQVLDYYLRLDADEVNNLAASHKKFLFSMPTEIPRDLLKFNKFNKFMKGNGIVYLGGDGYNQLALLSIKMLRTSGSKLPVELIVPKASDYDIDLCNNILPSLNGRCKVMAHYLPSDMMENVKGYQMKNIALLISSFENVLYLDADNIPVSNPDHLFVNEPFTSNHLILWPDLWRRSTSPLFYHIANIDTDPSIRLRKSYFNNDQRAISSDVSYHDAKGTIPEASSETGQILINKKVHFKTLILSMYYNYYGESYYYPLLSQGAAGEGDKETFIAAAHKLGLPYYQVKEFNREFGPLNGKNKHEFFGMGQYDPLIDHIQEANKMLSTDYEPDYAVNADDSQHSNYNFHYFKSSNLMFLHANWPKFKLAEMFIHNSHGRGPLGGNNKRRRLYDTNIIQETHGYDIELAIFKSLQWLFCELAIEVTQVPHTGTEDRNKICFEIHSHIVFLEGSKPL